MLTETESSLVLNFQRATGNDGTASLHFTTKSGVIIHITTRASRNRLNYWLTLGAEPDTLERKDSCWPMFWAEMSEAING